MADQAPRTAGRNTTGIVCTGDADYSFPAGFVKMIYWKPSAINDVICIRDVSATGAALMYESSADGGGKVQQVYAYCTPFFDYSACTIGTGANYEVTVVYDN